MKFAVAALFLFSFLPLLGSSPDSVRVTGLRVEYLKDPWGVDVTQPRFFWSMETDLRGMRQAAWQVEVASSEEKLLAGKPDMWNSGQVISDTSIQVVYAGRPLESDHTYFWHVRIWDSNGRSHLSRPARWRTGLFHPSDWHARWIGLDTLSAGDDTAALHRRLAARYLRKSFRLQGKIREATAYVTGLGSFEFYLNGKKVGNQVLAPALSDYDKRCYYLTFDVTPYLQEGENAAGMVLGNGRFFAPRTTVPVRTRDYGLPRAICQIIIRYEDGRRQLVVSDTSWKVTDQGPVRSNNEYDGEEYDARRELGGWTRPGYDDRRWPPASPMESPGGLLQAQPIPPLIVTDTLQPVAMWQVRPGIFLFDMGQNMVGWARLKVRGRRGDTVRLRFAERLRPDGGLFTANLRTALATDLYILRGEGEEVWQPRFTYHGFRYVEVTGYPGVPDLTTVTGLVVHDRLERTGTFNCSDTLVNAIYRNAVWGIRGNYRSIPTDCPQRDERQGWLGDRTAGSTGESYLFNIAALYNKWLTDMEDAQRPDGSIPDVAPSYWLFYNDNTTWAGTFLFIAEMLYTQYGDLRAIESHYPAMQRWIRHMSRYVHHGIMTRDTYGDWCTPPRDMSLIHTHDVSRMTPGDYIATAYWYRELMMMSRFAALLGHKEEEAAYAAEAATVRKAFHDRFFRPRTGSYANNSVTASVLALSFGLVPAEYREAVVANLLRKIQGELDNHVGNGIIGGQWLLRTLTGMGHPDVAWQLVTQDTYPSWGYMVRQGATTIWELWNGDQGDPSMNSGNHVMLLGDLLIWLYQELAGIRPDPHYPAFRHIVMKPYVPDGLREVTARYRSLHGMIVSHWLHDTTRFSWEITLPGNTLATLYVPVRGDEEVLENGIPASMARGLHFKGYEGGFAVFEAGSGNYVFTTRGVHMPHTMPYLPAPHIVPGDTSLPFGTTLRVRLICRDTAARIRYTTDGTIPRSTSALYRAPLIIDDYTLLQARAFGNGSLPSVSSLAVFDFYDPQRNGLRWSLYPGLFTRLPDMKKLAPERSGLCHHIVLDEVPAPATYFALRFAGYLYIRKTGIYTFFLTSNDGSRLFLDGKKVVDNDGLHGTVMKKGSIRLTRGYHPLEVDYFQNGGSSYLDVAWEGPQQPKQRLPARFLFLPPSKR